MIFSAIIPASQKDLKSQKYQDLIDSIKAQDFPQDQIEIITVTEGDSESAKAMGIRQAKGEICVMLCADNLLIGRDNFKLAYYMFGNPEVSAVYSKSYYYKSDDNSLNRYFSLIGGNDPVCYYLGKNDRSSQVPDLNIKSDYPPSYGCNGFFYRSELIKATNLNNYYPMDNALEVPGKFQPMISLNLWHRTSENIISFLMKRYKYARDLYSDRTNRRWKMLGEEEDYRRLRGFIVSTLSCLPCLQVSVKGYSKIKDPAWFWHWPVCVGFLVTYTILAIRNLFKHGRLFQVRCPSYQS